MGGRESCGVEAVRKVPSSTRDERQTPRADIDLVKRTVFGTDAGDRRRLRSKIFTPPHLSSTP
jgi:hypothetical protein